MACLHHVCLPESLTACPMSDDYYKTLGVGRSASQKEIETAYRERARKYHPDLNPDDKTAKKKFQDVQHAYDVLSDSKKREMYDRYGANFESAGAGQGGGGYGSRGPGAFEDVDFNQFFGERYTGSPGGGGGAGGGFADFFSQFGGGNARQQAQPGRQHGRDVSHELTILFNTAVTGGQSQIVVQRADGKTETITAKIPAGIEDGMKIRLRGQGEPAPSRRGKPGDILITIHVAPHPSFTRTGKNLYVRLPVTLAEAVEGAKVDVPTPKGTVALKIPPGTSSGAKLRVKGHGVAPAKGEPGDLFAEVQIILPKKFSSKAKELLGEAADALSYDTDVRGELRF